MKTLLLHIGMHKTGSSSIQASLDGFDDAGVRYLRLGHPNHSIPLRTLFADDRYAYHVHTRRGLSKAQVDQLAEQYQAALHSEIRLPHEVKIISGEDIAFLPEPALSQLRDLLAPHVDSIRVMAYARHPIAFLNSAYQEVVKNSTESKTPPLPDYRNRFERFFRVFGRENVDIADFDPRRFPDGSVVRDFLVRAGLGHCTPSEKRANESLSSLVTRLLVAFNRHGPLASGDELLSAARTRMIESLRSQFDGPAFRMADELAMHWVSRPDLDWLASETGIDYRDGLPEPANDAVERFEQSVDTITPDENARLRAYLQHFGVRTHAHEDVPEMLSRLYYAILLRTVVEAIDANKLKTMASKFASRAPLSREESVYLLQIAHWVRPGDASIASLMKTLTEPPPG
ncbi:MAG: hypothetical protein H2060_01930 [Azoarcus sp.]|nr:hypothetical protein [Azoarcus sp.]